MPIPTPIYNYHKCYETNDEDDDDITIISSNATNMKKSSEIDACEQAKLCSVFPTAIYRAVVERLSYKNIA